MSEWVANGRQKENRVLEQATEVPFLTSPPPQKKKKRKKLAKTRFLARI